MPEQEKQKDDSQAIFKISGQDIKEKVKDLIKEGNVRKIVITNEKDKKLMEVSLTVAVIGVVLTSLAASLCAMKALMMKKHRLHDIK